MLPNCTLFDMGGKLMRTGVLAYADAVGGGAYATKLTGMPLLAAAAIKLQEELEEAFIEYQKSCRKTANTLPEEVMDVAEILNLVEAHFASGHPALRPTAGLSTDYEEHRLAWWIIEQSC